MASIHVRVPDHLVEAARAVEHSGDDVAASRGVHGGLSAVVRLALERLLGVLGRGPGLHVYEACDGWRWVLRSKSGPLCESCRAFASEAAARRNAWWCADELAGIEP